MSFSSVGKRFYVVYGFLFLVNLLVLALSARVNQFQEFFYAADLFPLVLSITTFVFLFFMYALDMSLENSFMARPPFSISLFSLLTVFWLAFNSFSTSRWRYIPLACGSIPNTFESEKLWCQDLQALKSFVWIEWVMFLLVTGYTIRFCASQHTRGQKHVWSTPLSRYAPRANLSNLDPSFRSSNFLQFDPKMM